MRTILRDLQSVGGVRCGYVVRNGQILASTFAAEQAGALAASQELARGVAEGLALVDREWEEVLVDLGGVSLMVLPIEEGFTLGLLAGTDTNPDLLRVVMQSSVRQIRTMLALPPPAPTPPVSVQQPAAAAPPPKPEPARPAAAAPAQRPSQPQPQPAAAKPAAAPQKPAVEQRPAPAQKPAEQRPATAARPAVEQRPAAAARPAAEQKPAAQQKQAPPPPRPAAPVKPAAEPVAPAAAAKSGRAGEDAEPLLPKILELLTGSIGPVARVTFKRGVSRWKESNAPTVGNLPSLVEILAADLSSDEERRWFLEEVERLRGS
ncbi:MAG: hypothetical protein HY899_17825 [Deltaproteobacteria bacterium]|nr:hypothetical protein [Deltaproteobacteria bacterium]